MQGKIKIEDAGFDWKILGPDVPTKESDLAYVAWKSDQDAYAFSGQKCSAQSMLFVHDNWLEAPASFEQRIAALAATRTLADLTVGPVLTVTTAAFQAHVKALLALPGARLLFGGGTLEQRCGPHRIPACYGAFEPTAVFVPLATMLANDDAFAVVTREIFGPLQIVTRYGDGDLEGVLEACERMNNHLTAAVVSNDVAFRRAVLSRTVNGTTYVGMRARTTGAPQNHWFGPAGDPRAAGIGTPDAIRMVWSCHREIICDEGPVPDGFKCIQS